MLNSLSYKISDFFITNGKIALGKRDVFAYGISRLFTNAILLVSFVLIGWLMRDIKSVFIFLLFFIPLRKYAGGFHFNSNCCCYMASCLEVILVVIFRYAFSCLVLCLIFEFIASFIILRLAPIQSSNKKLTPNEKRIYKCKVKKIVIIYIFFSLLCILLKINRVYILIIASLFVESLLLLITKTKSL